MTSQKFELDSNVILEAETPSSDRSVDLVTTARQSKKTIDIEAGRIKRVTSFHANSKPIVIALAACAALGGLIFGYDIAGAGATFVMDGFKLHFGWECADGDMHCTPASEGTKNLDKGLINGFFGIGATIGALLNPAFSEKLGRRPCLAISNVVFIFGAAIQGYSPEMWVMWLGRIFSGMGIGMLSMCVPVYIAECAPEHVRGVLGTFWQVAVTAGILIASAANMGLKNWNDGWRLSYCGNIVFALILLVCLTFMPESPRWLAANRSEEELRAALHRVRFEDEVEPELIKLKEEVEEEQRIGKASWSEVFSKEGDMRSRALLGMSFQGFQQFCGINAIMFYAPDILNTFFTEDQAITGTFGLNGINFLATFITIATIDRFGRVKLLVWGGLCMILALVCNAIFASLDQTKTIGYCVLLFAALFIIGFAVSWGPVVWVVCSEMFPFHIRGKATGLTTATNWISTTIIGAVFPTASSASLSACFAFFAIVITTGTFVVYMLQPETANLTSAEIDEAYTKHEAKLKRKDW